MELDGYKRNQFLTLYNEDREQSLQSILFQGEVWWKQMVKDATTSIPLITA